MISKSVNTIVAIVHSIQPTWWLPEKISWTSHNALLPMGYFLQAVMCVLSDEKHLSYQNTSQPFILGIGFATKDPLDHLYKMLIGSNAFWEGHDIFSWWLRFQSIHFCSFLSSNMTLSKRDIPSIIFLSIYCFFCLSLAFSNFWYKITFIFPKLCHFIH